MKPSIPTSRDGVSCPTLRSWLRALTVIGAVAVCGQFTARAASNYVANAGFESGTANWTIVTPWTWNGPSYAVQTTNELVYTGTNHVTAHGGTNALKIWGYFQSYATTPGVQETFAAAPGSQWIVSGWISTQTPDNIRTNSSGVSENAYLQVLFLDSNTNANAPLGAFVSPGVSNSSPADTWLSQQVVDYFGNTTLTAPANTAFIRVQLIFYQPGGYPGGSAYFDDIVVNNVSRPDPEITVQPAKETTRVYGQSVTLSVVADGATTLSYKWQKDGLDITLPNAAGVTSAALTITNLTMDAMGTYTCSVSDQNGSVISDGAYLGVQDPGILSMNPAVGQTRTNGSTVNIRVTAAGSSALTYSWVFNGTALSDNTHYTGTTSSNLTILNATEADTGTYTVSVSGAASADSGLKVVPASQATTNLLVNPGFEDGVLAEPWETAWSRFNGAGLATTNNFFGQTTNAVVVHTGNYVGLVYNADPDNGVYQTVPATAGATYRCGGWFYMPSVAALRNTSFVVLQMMFKNAGGGNIATYSAQINSNSIADAWMYLQVTNAAGSADIVAPAGTVAITSQVYEFNWNNDGGTVAFDDLHLTQTEPAPPPAFSVAGSRVAGQMNVTFPSTIGVTYEVLYSSSLSAPISSWHTNATVVGDGSIRSVSDSLGPDARFYCVRAHY
jgi:Immunoglobulin domain